MRAPGLILILIVFLSFGCVDTAEKDSTIDEVPENAMDAGTKEQFDQMKEEFEGTGEVSGELAEMTITPSPTIITKVETTKYVCSDGKIVNEASECPILEALTIEKTFSGTSEDVTEQFYLDKGLVIITGHYVGESNFIVHLIDSEGNTVDSIFNKIGSFDGKHATQIKNGGYYRLGVEGIVGYNTGGSWTLKVEQES